MNHFEMLTKLTEHDLCWCGHTRAQHGVFGPMLCNHCTDCTGYIRDDKTNPPLEIKTQNIESK